MKGKIIDLLLLVWLMVCAADLLYLYFIGSWYDQYPLVEITELIFLVILIILPAIRIYMKLAAMARKEDNKHEEAIRPTST